MSLFAPTRSMFPSVCLTIRRLLAPLALLAGLVLSFAPAQAQTANDAALEAAMDRAYEWMDKAGADNTEAVTQANTQYEALFKQYPDHPLVMVYAGASRALLAYTTILPWKKIRHVEDGLALVDKSLALLPPGYQVVWPKGTQVGLETRFVAAKTFLDLPGFFNRGPRGETLLTEVLNDKQFAQAPLILRGQVWLQAAQSAAEDKRIDDARRWATLVVQNKAPQAAVAQALLKRL